MENRCLLVTIDLIKVAALSPVARPKAPLSVWLLVVLFPAVLTVLLNAARPAARMRPSRGMGAIAPSKVPKLIKKRDGNEPVKVFKQGGETKSKVNEAGNYTKPGLRKSIFNSVKAAAIVGTGAGQWSARKAQVMAKRYKAAGGGYRD